jgi:hypothetical protein
MRTRASKKSKIQSTAPARPRLSSFDPDAITIAEIHETQNALVELGLSAEIAALILNFAEYWCVQHFSLSTPLAIGYGFAQIRPPGTSHRTSLKEASSLYLQTGPIGCGEDYDALPLIKLMKVVFRIVSRDEGETMDMGRIGTFLNGSSWLDASIIREDESWTGGERQEPAMALMTLAPVDVLQNIEAYARGEGVPWYLGNNPFELPPWFCRDGDRTKLKGGFKLVPHGERLTWLLQRNRVSCYDFSDNRIEWKENVSENYREVGEQWWTEDIEKLRGKPNDSYEVNRDWMPDEFATVTGNTSWKNGISTNNEAAKEEDWPVDGSGSGRNFVKSLQRGDRIGIWARTLVSQLSRAETTKSSRAPFC